MTSDKHCAEGRERPNIRLTECRLRILRAANNDRLGLVSRPYFTGFSRVTWDRNAADLIKAGLLSRYVHGGFEITDAGRAALQALSNEEGG